MEAGYRKNLLASRVNLFADTGQFPKAFLTIMQYLGSKPKGFDYIPTHIISVLYIVPDTHCLLIRISLHFGTNSVPSLIFFSSGLENYLV